MPQHTPGIGPVQPIAPPVGPPIRPGNFSSTLNKYLPLVKGNFYWPIDLGGPMKDGIHQDDFGHMLGYFNSPGGSDPYLRADLVRNAPRHVFSMTDGEVEQYYYLWWIKTTLGTVNPMADQFSPNEGLVWLSLHHLGQFRAIELLQLALRTPISWNMDAPTMQAIQSRPDNFADLLQTAQHAYYTYNPVAAAQQQVLLQRMWAVKAQFEA